MSGAKPVKMERLRAMFEALGFLHVRSYVQSGNVVFDSKERAAAGLAPKLATKLATEIAAAIQARVWIRRAGAGPRRPRARAGWSTTIRSSRSTGSIRLGCTSRFLAGAPVTAGLKKMEGVSSGRDEFLCQGNAIYLHCPDGYGNTKLNNNAFERALGVEATTRNWKTVTTLAAMASGESASEGA